MSAVFPWMVSMIQLADSSCFFCRKKTSKQAWAHTRAGAGISLKESSELNTHPDTAAVLKQLLCLGAHWVRLLLTDTPAAGFQPEVVNTTSSHTQHLYILISKHLSQRRLDTYAANVIVRWTQSNSTSVIACLHSYLNHLVPMSIWPGTKGKRANVKHLVPWSLLCDRFYTMQMAEGSNEEHKHPVFPASLPFRSLTQPYSQNDLGVEQGWLDIRILLH